MMRWYSRLRTALAKKGFPVIQRRRDQFTDWKNSKPVSDLHELLSLLMPRERGSYRDRRYLCPKKERPELEVAWYHDPCDEESRGYHYYEVDPLIAQQAVRERLVDGGARDSYGIWRFADHKLSLSDTGRKLLDKYIREQAEKARKLLQADSGRPGDTLTYRAYGRDGEDGEGGRLYIEFETQKGERMRAYPASKPASSPLKECA